LISGSKDLTTVFAIAVQLFLMGKNHWLALPEFPQSPITKNLYLSENKQLSSQSPITNHQLPDIYVYDPRNPNPSTNYGFYDQRNVHQRWDILVYQGDELEGDFAIAGIPEFILHAATTAPDTDWVIKLLDIYPDGKQMLVSMGVLRARFCNSWTEHEWVEPDVVNEYRIKLRPTCQNFAKGHRIGVVISSSAFPMIERHSNTQMLPSEAMVSDFVEATQQVFYGVEYPSCLMLPVC
jgi:putative CocE/NonD family hydrolase